MEDVKASSAEDTSPSMRARSRSMAAVLTASNGAHGSPGKMKGGRRMTTISNITSMVSSAPKINPGLRNSEVQGASFAEEQLPSSGALTVETDRDVIRNIQESVMQTYAHYAILSQCTLTQLLDEEADGQDDVSFGVRGKQIRSKDLTLLGSQLKLMSFAPRIMRIDLRRNLLQGGDECGVHLQKFLHTLFGFATNLTVGERRLDRQ